MAADGNDWNLRLSLEFADEQVRKARQLQASEKRTTSHACARSRSVLSGCDVSLARPDAHIWPIDPHLNRPPATSLHRPAGAYPSSTENGAPARRSTAPPAAPTHSRPENDRPPVTVAISAKDGVSRPAQRNGIDQHIFAPDAIEQLRGISSDCSDRCHPRSESARGGRMPPRSHPSRRASRRRAAWYPTDRDDRARAVAAPRSRDSGASTSVSLPMATSIA